jgi:PD-(D/E)XK nuclease superfamily
LDYNWTFDVLIMFTHIPHNFPKLVQENIDGTRYYLTPDGKRYPSVTTVLADYNKQGILEWRKKVGEAKANEISRKATTRGTSVHSVIERYLKNEDMSSVEMLPNVKNLFVKMKEELKKLDNIHCLEEKLYSHELGLAGTVDCIAEHQGVLSVIDFKTANRLKKKEQIGNYFMQGAAYANMFTEMTGIEINQVIILIGVDSANFCQTLKLKKEEILLHTEELKKYIDSHRANTVIWS